MNTTAHAPAAAADEIDPARWDSMDEDGAGGPWLYDPDGNVLRLPARCIGFQIRYWPHNARGIGELVLDDEEGCPLFLSRTSGPEDFREAVGYRVGRYRLFLLDEDRQRMRHVPAQVTITKKAADKHRERLHGGAESVSSSAPVSAAPASSELMALAFMRMLDIIDRGQGQALGSVTDLVRAAGDAGIVAKATAMAAAHAGQGVIAMPVTAPAPTSSGATSTPPAPTSAPAEAVPRDAAAAKSVPDEDEEEKRSGASMVAEMLKPFADKLAPVAAYSAAKAMNCSEEQAREFAGMAGGAVSKGLDVLVGGKPAEAIEIKTPSTSSTAPLSGAALDAHVAAIRDRLSSDEETLLRQIGLRHYPRYTELTALVGTMAVGEGVETIRKVASIWRDLIESERLFLHRMIDESGFAVLTHVADQDTVEQAVQLVRRAKAAEDAQGASAPAA